MSRVSRRHCSQDARALLRRLWVLGSQLSVHLVLWLCAGRPVHMHKGALDIVQSLYLVLQGERNVVRFPHGHVRRQHHFHFNQVVCTAMGMLVVQVRLERAAHHKHTTSQGRFPYDQNYT